MTRIRITKLERHEAGFFTANVTAEGGDTVRVDNSIGCWTVPVDPNQPLGARCLRRELLPWVVEALLGRVGKFLRGEADAEDGHDIEAGPGGTRNVRRAPEPETKPDDVAEQMAQAGLDALRRAA